MRISDWSSDVCSSDLRRGYCRDGSHRHSYIEASCGVVYPEAVAIAHSRSKGGPSMGRMTKPGAAAKRSGKMQIAWPSAWKVGTPIGVRPRSEEHTSELQSLMRISYAVFCLKKKKNNN